MNFKELNLSTHISDALDNLGFLEATEIQALSIPHIQAGSDVLGLSHTGSGKTFAFGIPALEKVNVDQGIVQILIVCPTRELAGQTTDELRKLTTGTEGLKIVPIFGGSNLERQIQSLRKNAKIVVGTPGRIMDHLRRKTLKLKHLKMLVLDEADEMLDMGFRQDIDTILESSNPEKQTVMFSATMAKEILAIAKKYMNSPVTVKSSIQDSPQEFIEQRFIFSKSDKKFDTFTKLCLEKKPKTSIVFCNTKRMTTTLSQMLKDQNIQAECINGDMRQGERKRVMDNFKDKGGILVATDVAARGIDIKNVDIVFNYDFPQNTDYYVHRIGRTARAGKEGLAITIINSKAQLKEMEYLMKETKNNIVEMKVENVVGFDLSERPSSRQGNGERSSFSDGNSRGQSRGSRFGGSRDGRKPFGRSENEERAPRRSDAPSFETAGDEKRESSFKREEKRNFSDRSNGWGEKKSFSSSSERPERKSYSNNWNNDNSLGKTERGEKRNNFKSNEGSFEKRDSYVRNEGVEKRFTKSDGEGRRNYTRNEGEGRGFSKNADGEKRYSRNSEGEKRNFRNEGGEKRVFAKSADGDRNHKRNADGEKRGFSKSADGEKRFSRNESGERRGFSKSADEGKRERSSGFSRDRKPGESFGKSQRPERFKSKFDQKPTGERNDEVKFASSGKVETHEFKRREKPAFGKSYDGKFQKSERNTSSKPYERTAKTEGETGSRFSKETGKTYGKSTSKSSSKDGGKGFKAAGNKTFSKSFSKGKKSSFGGKSSSKGFSKAF